MFLWKTWASAIEWSIATQELACRRQVCWRRKDLTIRKRHLVSTSTAKTLSTSWQGMRRLGRSRSLRGILCSNIRQTTKHPTRSFTSSSSSGFCPRTEHSCANLSIITCRNSSKTGSNMKSRSRSSCAKYSNKRASSTVHLKVVVVHHFSSNRMFQCLTRNQCQFISHKKRYLCR